MNFPASLFVGFRYSNSRKSNQFIAFINLFSISGIALGLMALIITSSVMNGFESQLKDRILGLSSHFIVDTKPESLPTELSPYVKGTTPFLESEAVLQSTEGLKPIYIQGVEPESFEPLSLLSDKMRIGALSTLKPGDYQLVIGRALALNLNLAVGDEVRVILAGTSVYTPLGRMPAQRVFRVSGIFDVGSELDDKVAIANIHDLARLQRMRSSQIAQTRLFLNDPFEYLSVRDVLDNANLGYLDWRERQGALFDAVKMEKNMMQLMLLLIVAVAAFNIVSALVMVVSEKQGDIAILRTQGMSKYQIMQVFLINGLSNGLKGTFIGAVLGLLVATQINNIMQVLQVPILAYLPEGMLPINIDYGQIGAMVALSLLLCLLASIYPARRALKVEPASALRYE